MTENPLFQVDSFWKRLPLKPEVIRQLVSEGLIEPRHRKSFLFRLTGKGKQTKMELLPDVKPPSPGKRDDGRRWLRSLDSYHDMMTHPEFEEKFAGSFTVGERSFLWANEHFQTALKTFDNGTISGLQQIERIGLALIRQNNNRPT